MGHALGEGAGVADPPKENTEKDTKSTAEGY